MIYLQPHFRTSTAEIINIMSSDGQEVGYITYVYKENKELYVLGQLDDIGEQQNFIDIVEKYIVGLKNACAVQEDPYVYIHAGGVRVDLDNKDKN